MRHTGAAAALIVCAATAASANTGHHDVGGGNGGVAECIRWEPIPLDMAGRDLAVADMAGAAGVDMAGVDMAGVDMAGLDMARPRSDMAIPVRCAERASLFNCAFTPGSARDRDNALGLALLGAIVVFEIWRARYRPRG
jgi:hypothetical protein